MRKKSKSATEAIFEKIQVRNFTNLRKETSHQFKKPNKS